MGIKWISGVDERCTPNLLYPERVRLIYDLPLRLYLNFNVALGRAQGGWPASIWTSLNEPPMIEIFGAIDGVRSDRCGRQIDAHQGAISLSDMAWHS